MDLKEKLELAAKVKFKGNQYFKVRCYWSKLEKHKYFLNIFNCKQWYPPLSGRMALPGSHPVPANHFLVGNGVWCWFRRAEEDPGLPADITPQSSFVLPAYERVFTCCWELQQGDLEDPDVGLFYLSSCDSAPECFGYVLTRLLSVSVKGYWAGRAQREGFVPPWGSSSPSQWVQSGHDRLSASAAHKSLKPSSSCSDYCLPG